MFEILLKCLGGSKKDVLKFFRILFMFKFFILLERCEGIKFNLLWSDLFMGMDGGGLFGGGGGGIMERLKFVIWLFFFKVLLWMLLFLLIFFC